MGNKIQRLNLGSGNDYREGWVNVDVAGDYRVDVIADLSKPFPFAADSVDEILASDIVEHFTKEEGEKFLRECYRVLKVHGKLTIRTHNIYQIFQQFKNDPDVLIHFLYGNTEETGVFGAHKFAHTEKTIRTLLERIGFRVLTIDKETTNFLINAEKKAPKTLPKLRIAVIQQTPDIGGAETYMLSLLNALKHEGHTILLASNLDKFLKLGANFQTYSIPVILDVIGDYKGLIKSILLFPYALYFYISFLRKLKKERVDVILMSGFSEKLLVTALSPFFSIPVVWIEYGRLETIFPRNFYLPKVLYRLVKSIPRKVIVPSKNTMLSLMEDGRVSLSKLTLIPCGVAIPGKKQYIRGEVLPDCENAFIIGNVSRLTKEKGQEFLIHAMPEVIKHIPSAKLLLIGNGPDRSRYSMLIQDLGLEERVIVTGFVSDPYDYYPLMDLFVFPTVWELEGFGVVLPEAMVHHLPIVAARTGPVPEIIDDQKTGILVPPGDSHAIAEAITNFYNNTRKRKELAENGYKKAKEKYTISKVSEKVQAILYEAIL